jgi:hypothetical protein
MPNSNTAGPWLAGLVCTGTLVAATVSETGTLGAGLVGLTGISDAGSVKVLNVGSCAPKATGYILVQASEPAIARINNIVDINLARFNLLSSGIYLQFTRRLLGGCKRSVNLL